MPVPRCLDFQPFKMLGDLLKNPRSLTICLLAATVCAAPWLFGGVLADHQFGILLALGVCLLLLLVSRWGTAAPQRLPAAFAWLLLAGLFGVLQLVPLSPAIGEKFAPTSWHWWQTAAPRATAENAITEFPVSVYPFATRYNLAMLAIPVAAVAAFASVMAGAELACLLLGVFAVNGALFALFGLVQLLSYNGQIYWSVPLEDGGGPFAAFVNRNHAGAYLNLCFAAAIGFLIWVRDRRRSRLNVLDQFTHRQQLWFAYGLASICATGVVCTLSRGAVVSFIGAALLVLLVVPQLRRNQAVRNGILVASAVGLAAAVALGQGSALSERFEGISQQQTAGASSRLRHWQDVSAAIFDYWQTGSGIGSYRFAYWPYEQRFVAGWFHHAENQYLEALVEGGVIGFGLLLIVLVFTWRSAISANRAVNASPAAIGIGAACLFAVAAQTIHATFDFNLYMPAVGMLFAFFVAAAWVFRHSAVDRAGGPISALAIVATLLWVGWSVAETNRIAKLDELLRELRSLDRSGPISGIIGARYADELKNATERMPAHSKAQLQYGRLLVDLFRTKLTDELKRDLAQPADDELIWNSTSLSSLNGRYFELQREGQSLAAVTGSAAAKDYLGPAFQAALSAADACPLSPSAHVLIAQLAPLAGEQRLQTTHAEIALRIRPYDPENLYVLGQLDIQAGRTALGYQRWQQCLELSSRYAEEIVRSSLIALAHIDFIEKVMPRDVLRSVDLVKRHFDDPRFVEIRPLLGKHLRRLDKSDLTTAQRAYVDAKTLDLLDQPDSAAEALGRAVKQEPTRVAWRYELAQLFERIGNLPQAHQHALICVQMAPHNRAFAQFLIALERQMTGQTN